MASKLLAQSKAVETTTGKLMDCVKERYKYRLWVGTLREQTIPNLRSQLMELLETYETQQKAMQGRQSMGAGRSEGKNQQAEIQKTAAEIAKVQQQIASRQKQMNDISVQFSNATKWAQQFVATLRADMKKLDKMLDEYDPGAKKSGANMRPGQAQARLKKKEAAMAIAEKAEDFLSLIDDDLK